MIAIRLETPRDVRPIHALNEQAFKQRAEACIVDKLRQACGDDFISLVAVEGETIVGHILFTPVTVKSGKQVVAGMGLAPMAVLPGRQNQGIGSLLIQHGLDALRKRGCPFVVVLGHPDYYPRFGFRRASIYKLRSPWKGVPDEAFMALILDPETMTAVAGIVRYRPEFNEAV